MLHSPRQLIGPTLVALAIVVLAAAPVAAKHPVADFSPGAFVADVYGATHDRDGVLSLRVRYSCSPYEAPFDGSDLVIASITSGESGYDGFEWVTCDGSSQQLTLSLLAFNGGVEGDTYVQFTHEGMEADGTGTASVTTGVPVRVKVK
jgi:hypothetical protein